MCVGRVLTENPDLAMETVAHVIHAMSGAQRAEVARLLSTIENTDPSTTSAESTCHA